MSAGSRWLPRWRPLEAGDIVDIVAPASSASPDALEAGMATLRAWSLRPRMPEGLIDARDWHANTDERRWHFLRRAMMARDSAAVWCARGGVGSLRLLPRLARLQPPVPKPIIGFSDVSALLVGIEAVRVSHGIHGPVLTQLAPGRLPAADIARVRGLLFGELPALRYRTLRPLNASARGPLVVEGPAMGGNLNTVHSLGGTPFQMRARGRIVFFEDVNERGYAIDRMLTGLRLSGALKGARAVVFGHFTDGEERDGRDLAPRALRAFADEVRLPVFTGLPAGHGPRLVPLVVGLNARIEGDGRRATLVQSLGEGR